jgi:hypothetical protein
MKMLAYAGLSSIPEEIHALEHDSRNALDPVNLADTEACLICVLEVPVRILAGT